MTLDELKKHCLKTLKQTEKFPTKTFEEHALVLLLIENQTSVIDELEKLKTKVIKLPKQGYFISSDGIMGGYRERSAEDYEVDVLNIIDNCIKELKGENNGID